MRTSAPKISPGDVLAGQYRVEGVLGSGGMGTVYAVTNTRTNAAVAMKVVVDTGDKEHVTRFFREGRATIRIESDYVVRVFDLGSIDGTLPYMVMERLVGTTLKAKLKEDGPFDERTVADLMLQACEGLAHAHASGIIHRDIKPSNIFIVGAHEGPRLKILDFGISKMASLEDWERTTTESGAFLGSPYYVSPEQLKNPSRIDQRADLWSLGVTMYNALSGKHPFEGGSLAELLVGVMSGEPIPLATRCRASSAMLAIVERCLDRSLERRFRDTGELARALAPLASPRWAALVPRITELASTTRSEAERGRLPLGNSGAEPPSWSKRSPQRPSAPPAVRSDEHTMTFDEPLPGLRRADTTMTIVEPLALVEPRALLQRADATLTIAEPMPGSAPALDSGTGPPPPFATPSSRPSVPTGTGSAIPVVHGQAGASGLQSSATSAPTSPRGRPIGIALTVLTAVAIAGGAAAFARTREQTAAMPTATSSAAEPGSAVFPPPPPIASSGAPTAETSSAVDPNELTIELTAQGPITKVMRPIARRVSLEGGKAKVTVSRFRGDLAIDVEVLGGGRAHGVAHEGGPTAIALIPTPGRPGRPHPPGSRTAAPKGSAELHDSPYK